MNLRIPVEVVAVLADPVQLRKYSRSIHPPTPEVHVTTLVVDAESVVEAVLATNDL